jgi:hypothetical protein
MKFRNRRSVEPRIESIYKSTKGFLPVRSYPPDADRVGETMAREEKFQRSDQR